jgi:hypothetical protein
MDSISKQIVRSDRFLPKLLVGSLLMYSVIGIPFLLGFLTRFWRNFHTRSTIDLPQWSNWTALLMECWELLLLVVVYALLPVGLLLWLTCSLDAWFGVHLWFPFRGLLWLPLAIMAFVSAPLVALAFHVHLRSSDLKSCLIWPPFLRTYLDHAEALTALTLLFWGVVLLGLPIYGIAFTFAATLYVPLVFNVIDKH